MQVTLENAEFVDSNARNALKVENAIRNKASYSFAAVGNVMNSMGIFREKMIPLINASNADFVVFTGNSVMDGGNDKYAALRRTLDHLEKPVLFVMGDTEISDRGVDNYFHHFGNPYFFFTAGDSMFVFIDTTGYTGEEIQFDWLNEILRHFNGISRRFVFMNKPLLQDRLKNMPGEYDYKISDAYTAQLMDLFTDDGATVVISSSNGVYDDRMYRGVQFIATGGGGGVYNSNDAHSAYYYTEISVSADSIQAVPIKPELAGPLPRISIVEYAWNRIYSWVYVSFLNIILFISLAFAAVYSLYGKLVTKIDYYPDLTRVPDKNYPLTVAMFTNNYLPFIGGVPLSILRLKSGLEKMGHRVYIFAPQYGKNVSADDDRVIRFSPLFHYRKGDLIVPVSNIFSRKIRRQFVKINPDIVHVHHPFWLGNVGKRLAAKFGKPIVFTYHTRIEQYNHYVPFFRRLAGGQIPHLLIKYFASACDAVIAPTTSAKRYLRNLGIGKLIVVQPTGVVLQPPLKKAEALTRKAGETVLFSVFRLSKEKNPYFMIDGLKLLSSITDQKFVCYIAGTGPEEESLAAYIRENGLDNTVILLGKVDPAEIASYYEAADMFIFSSMSETQGMVILEAMAASTPVVAVESSGISDLVVNGENGYKTAADVAAWSEKIRYLIENPEARNEMGARALKTAEANSLEAMCANILDMYYDIIDWKKRHPDKVFIR